MVKQAVYTTAGISIDNNYQRSQPIGHEAICMSLT